MRYVILQTGVAALAATGALHGQTIELTERAGDAGLDAVHAPLPDAIDNEMERMSGGVAVGDFDRDGDQDLIWAGGGGTPDRLYLNDGTGNFVDAAAAWGLVELHTGNAIAVGDVDGDGLLDFYMTSFGPIDVDDGLPGSNRLYRNTGTSFVEIAQAAGVNQASPVESDAFGAAFGDYDLDGDLDLFVASWKHESDGNRLFRNDTVDGVIQFTDVTDDAMPDNILGAHGFQPAFCDMNGDCYPEILLAADHETSRYYMNNGDGTFEKTTPGQNLGLDDNGMGQTIGDFDNDGLLDWYVTSIYEDDPPPFRNPGNMLYSQLGNHFYDEISQEAGTLDGGWGWGAVAVDLDQDGWLDIVEVNGWWPGWADEFQDEPAKLFHNQGNGFFTEVAEDCNLTHIQRGRTVVTLDADRDGDLDFVITSREAAMELYRNDTPSPGHWLQMTFDTSGNPLMAPDGFGVRVEADTKGLTQQRVLNGSPSYLGTCELSLHFGLGDATSVNELRVHWPRCRTSVLQNVAADQFIELTAPLPGDVNADGAVNVEDLIAMFAEWGPDAPLDVDLDGNGEVDANDLILLLADWS